MDARKREEGKAGKGGTRGGTRPLKEKTKTKRGFFGRPVPCSGDFLCIVGAKRSKKANSEQGGELSLVHVSELTTLLTFYCSGFGWLVRGLVGCSGFGGFGVWLGWWVGTHVWNMDNGSGSVWRLLAGWFRLGTRHGSSRVSLG